MSSILPEDIIKVSYKPTGQFEENKNSDNLFLTDADFDSRFDARYDNRIGSYHQLNIVDLLDRVTALEEKLIEKDARISELEDQVGELLEEKSKDSCKDDLRVEARANLVYPELCKKGKLSTGDVKRICKITNYSSIYRVCEKVVEMHPEECVYGKGISGTGYKYLALKDYRGF